MQLERPRFRQDLVAELVEDGNHRFVDLMDPDSGNVYRFYEVEYSLACAMDGERDVPGIVRWAQEELGLQANPNEIKSVIATLGDLGYLDGGAPAARPETPAHQAPIDEELGRGVVVGSKRVNTPVRRHHRRPRARKRRSPMSSSPPVSRPGVARRNSARR